MNAAHHQDRELFFFTTMAAILFGAIALFFGRFVKAAQRNRRVKPPHRTLILVFRAWFGALALGALYLVLFGHQGLFPR